jgi:four helix bundle protein
MAKIVRFEEIIAWQKARILCNIIRKFTRKPEFKRDFKLSSQITDSSGSVMDNIAEGFERGGNKEFIQFLFISKGSCGEVKSQLYRAIDSEYIDQNEFEDAYQKADEIGKVLEGFIEYLRHSEVKGRKFDANV